MSEPEVPPAGESPQKPRTLVGLLGGRKNNDLEASKFARRPSTEPQPVGVPKSKPATATARQLPPAAGSTPAAPAIVAERKSSAVAKSIETPADVRGDLHEIARNLGSSATRTKAVSVNDKASPGSSGPQRVDKPMTMGARVVLCTGLAMVAAALGSVVIDQFKSPAPPQAFVNAPVSKETEILHTQSRAHESRFPQPAEPAALPAANEVHEKFAQRRQMMLRSLEKEGMQPAFYPAANLRVKPGEKQTVYCLLREPLDPLTEEEWEKAGLFAHENEVFSPFLRTITIATPAQLLMLNDSRVESIADELFPRALAENKQPD